MSHEGFLKIAGTMGPLLVIMFLPVWLPLLVAVVGKLVDLVGTGRVARRVGAPAPSEKRSPRC